MGPRSTALAAEGDPAAVAFPAPCPADRDFSFAGLKTAVVNHVRHHPDTQVADVAASFQEAVVDQLVVKLLAAADAADARTRSCSAAASRRIRGCATGGRGRRVDRAAGFLPAGSSAPTTGR